MCWAPGKISRPQHLLTDLRVLGSLRVKQVLLAQAEAEKIRKIGEAEAAVIEAMGKAEAERMKLKAEAYQKYGDAAKMALVLEALPQVRFLPTQAYRVSLLDQWQVPGSLCAQWITSTLSSRV